jgi:hypothetical protein
LPVGNARRASADLAFDGMAERYDSAAAALIYPAHSRRIR